MSTSLLTEAASTPTRAFPSPKMGTAKTTTLFPVARETWGLDTKSFPVSRTALKYSRSP